MGYGSYTAQDWAKLKASRGLSSSSSANQTFTRSAYSEKLDSRFISTRESFDSSDSPNSTPIIIGFDVTGSMGYLANEIATNSLNETIMQILAKKPVSDPHLMCAAFTDPTEPLQATQFEADIRVVEQLLDFKLGGGNAYAYDTLLWYFAAKHTKTDSFEKRGKKGILIGIGDEICGVPKHYLSAINIKNIFGDNISHDLSFHDLLSMAQEKYEVVHIVVGQKFRFDPSNSYASYDGWAEALPGRVAGLEEHNIKYLSDLITAILQLLSGVSKDEILAGLPFGKRGIIKKAMEDMC